MKFNIKVSSILLVMFLATQLIGLLIIHADIFHIEKEINGQTQTINNPHLTFIQPPNVTTHQDSFGMLGNLVIAFIVAIILMFILSKFKIEFLLRIWFLVVVYMALFLAFYAIGKLITQNNTSIYLIIIPALIALPLAIIKIYKKIFVLHNITEFLIYPGIATVFVPILNIYTVIILLILISIYDMWAVWRSGIMQKMAKYQINKLKIFAGFIVPYADSKTRQKIKELKQKLKQKKLTQKQLAKRKIKVQIAILGGGDIIFPIITAGVVMNTYGIIPALFVTLGSLLGLGYLLFIASKKKWYPAMPFITTGCLLGMLIGWALQI